MSVLQFGRKKKEERGTETPTGIHHQIAVGYQGAPGAYSFEAARSYFGEAASLNAYPSFDNLCQAVSLGYVSSGLLPIANSQTGHIPEMESLLHRYGLRTMTTIDYPVHHCLLCLPGQQLRDIVIVVSHPQALAQCSRYLAQLTEVQITPTENTAASAKMIHEQQLKGFAAIASARAADYYHLHILASNIQDHSNNMTRFAIIAKP